MTNDTQLVPSEPTPKPSANALAVAVDELRQASRLVVRELGFLGAAVEDGSGASLTHSQCHALIELERHGLLTAGQLATALNLDKSTLSRSVAQLLEADLVGTSEDAADRRKRLLSLTPKGERTLGRIHAQANRQVEGALALLPDTQRAAVVLGMTLYAKALGRLREQRQFSIRPIARRDNPIIASIIRKVMTELGACGPGFAIHDPEVAAMHAAYARRGSSYLVLERQGRVVGGGGFGALVGGNAEVCELRKMYLLPEARGSGMGRRVLDQLLAQAREAGYRLCYLETLQSMTQARRLYESCGFEPVARPMGNTGHFGCDAWYVRPLDG